MAIRLGVDVGGTFTKAVAIHATSGEIVARAVVPTTHAAAAGIGEGVLETIRQVRRQVSAGGHGPILMVAHSTSLAVNSLLEGDLPRVGLIAIGRAPDLGAARRRTDLRGVSLTPGRALEPIYRFLDASDGLSAAMIESTVDELISAGAEAIAASEAFAVEDPRHERAVLAAIEARGVPGCAGHQLSGLLGLELRTVSAVVNAAVMPRARSTARVVADGMRADGIEAPLVVLRGDGGATNLEAFTAMPLSSLFSGPAASVAGALHHLAIHDGVMLEVGGTSTNVALIQGGRPRQAYVRVGRYATCVRSLDVWVAGIGGGSLARVRGRRIIGVGPRSAHIAGLAYASFADPSALEGARAVLVSPTPGDAPDHLVVEAVGGRFALTPTCAANALDLVETNGYAHASGEAARAAFAGAAATLGTNGVALARSLLGSAADELSHTVRSACSAAGTNLRHFTIVGLGGGAGAVVPSLALAVRRPWEIARHAEVISSIGAALSLIQAVAERSAADGPDVLPLIMEQAEAAAVAAGAAPASVQTSIEHDQAAGTVRARSTGSLPLEAGVDPTAARMPEAALAERAASLIAKRGGTVREIANTRHYAAFAGPSHRGREPWIVLDRRGSVAHSGHARHILVGTGDPFTEMVKTAIRASERQLGPASVAPPVVLLADRRVIDYSSLAVTASVTSAVEQELARNDARENREPAVVAIEHERG